ncbi:hypothetical protein [Streptomyces sp. NPDC056227]|uniref:hypothetical protein n=1 Tax=Streptomyces sp. NPDC056227 TaxID=3345753 RepID=UPI0035DFA284
MELLCHQQRCQNSALWSEDVEHRLNTLVRAAAAAGERTSRAELLAVLVIAVEVAPSYASRCTASDADDHVVAGDPPVANRWPSQAFSPWSEVPEPVRFAQLVLTQKRYPAENADGAAYADAVSEYAALGWDELLAAARKLLAPTSGRG